jgi:hypothetical protein
MPQVLLNLSDVDALEKHSQLPARPVVVCRNPCVDATSGAGFLQAKRSVEPDLGSGAL